MSPAQCSVIEGLNPVAEVAAIPGLFVGWVFDSFWDVISGGRRI